MASLDLAAWCSRLPVAEALPRVAVALAEHGAAVLEAPPGAGKTTLVPLMLLEAAWLQGRRILMLEPRRPPPPPRPPPYGDDVGGARRRDRRLSHPPRHQGRATDATRGLDRGHS